jgi:hypothetical protein
VFPWVLSDYTSTEIPDLNDPKNYRDLSKPVGALNPERLAEFQERFETFADPSIPPFMYGSHYSTSAGVVLHFLVRLVSRDMAYICLLSPSFLLSHASLSRHCSIHLLDFIDSFKVGILTSPIDYSVRFPGRGQCAQAEAPLK